MRKCYHESLTNYLPLFVLFLLIVSVGKAEENTTTKQIPPVQKGLLATELLSGEGVWVDPKFALFAKRSEKIMVKVWFEEQFLGDGAAYVRRSKEFSKKTKRRALRSQTVATLKTLSDRSWKAANKDIEKLIDQKIISDIERHWIINGFTCVLNTKQLDQFKKVKGVKKIFVTQRRNRFNRQLPEPKFQKPVAQQKFDPARYLHPWYSRYLMADKVWKEFNISGQGTLNIVSDFNFVLSDNIIANMYHNPKEKPGNGKDDDGNGLIDDYHGYNFTGNTPTLTLSSRAASMQTMHGHLCAAIICGAGLKDKKYEFGIAPQGKWAGVIASGKLEAAIEWAIEQEADTYSMSFSIPNLGEYRSHWRKVMEHGSYCGIYFVSGAGNFAQRVKVPVQMRVPEDIPNVVFAAAGVQRNFSRTPFSSKGPVKWNTEHYNDGMVAKPEVCAFNMGLPVLFPNGKVASSGASGNSFAGPMFCGCIALMLSADPDLLPWDLREIITSTATDVAAEGVDDETGHGLINCYRAVKEVLRRKMLRDGGDPKPYTGRIDGDTFDVETIRKKLTATKLKVLRVQPNSQAAKLGIKQGDIFVSYNKQKVANQQGMQKLKQQATQLGLKEIPLVITRNGKTIEFKLKPGQLGIASGVEYDDPAFQ